MASQKSQIGHPSSPSPLNLPLPPAREAYLAKMASQKSQIEHESSPYRRLCPLPPEREAYLDRMAAQKSSLGCFGCSSQLGSKGYSMVSKFFDKLRFRPRFWRISSTVSAQRAAVLTISIESAELPVGYFLVLAGASLIVWVHIPQNIEATLRKIPEEKRSDAVFFFFVYSSPMAQCPSSTQSQVGPSAWIGPQTRDALKGLARLGKKHRNQARRAFAYRIHERSNRTLYELDLEAEYGKEAREARVIDETLYEDAALLLKSAQMLFARGSNT
ncbi:hypothetical protein BGY98DRAFT_1097302 [Russula aff. rugulosa BPL654]|nr:hypothetical protein BGY98DRAFT_1097302 [Russula aff. rugulosa BPL654]